jgi:polyphenol oxidase
VFAFQDTQDRVEIAFTDRHGGTSGGPFASLNLSPATGDDADAVTRNLDLVGRAFAGGRPLRRLFLMHQVHGAGVHVVDDADLDAAHPPVVDALVTALPGVALVVRVADCVPVLLADPVAGVVAAVHAGRPGMVSGVVDRAVDAFTDAGATPGDTIAVVGPSVCGRCYEVPDGMRAKAAAVSAPSATVSWTGTPAIDVAAGVVDQLTARGIRVTWVPGCTRESPDLFSYRRDGTTRRFAGVVRLLPETA